MAVKSHGSWRPTDPVQDLFAWSDDNIRLHARVHGAGGGAIPLLCLPGLTRNARDFQTLAERLAGARQVVALSLRGRGDSGWAADKLSYVPLTYLRDVGHVTAAVGLDRFAVIGTSLGGLLGLMLPMAMGNRVAGLVLNDVGPALEPAGVARVREAIERRQDGWPSWLVAARALARRHQDQHPGFTLDDWLAHARRLCRVSREGRIVFDYDPGIAAPLALPNPDAGPDLWVALDRLAEVPLLSLRGERSDILSADTQAAMAARIPGLEAVTVPGVGHAPTLDEPAAVAAIDRFLGRLA